MQQFLLSFFIDAAAAVFYTDYHCISLLFHFHQHFRIFVAEFNGIAQQIANNGFQHINIGTDRQLLRLFFTDGNFLQAGHHIEHINHAVYHFHGIHILIDNIQVANLAFCPLQQVIQQ